VNETAIGLRSAGCVADFRDSAKSGEFVFAFPKSSDRGLKAAPPSIRNWSPRPSKAGTKRYPPRSAAWGNLGYGAAMGGFYVRFRHDLLESGHHQIAAATQAASATRWVRQISAKFRIILCFCPELLALADAIERFADRLG
jgi:hypothetical protein